MNENLSGEQISHLVKELFQQHLRTGLENFTRSERVRNKALKNECVRIFKDLRRNRIPLEIALATYSCLGHQALVVGLLAKAAERQKKINTSTVHELIRHLAGDSQKAEEVIQCFNAWGKDPKSYKSLTYKIEADDINNVFSRLAKKKPVSVKQSVKAGLTHFKASPGPTKPQSPHIPAIPSKTSAPGTPSH